MKKKSSILFVQYIFVMNSAYQSIFAIARTRIGAPSHAYFSLSSYSAILKKWLLNFGKHIKN